MAATVGVLWAFFDETRLPLVGSSVKCALIDNAFSCGYGCPLAKYLVEAYG